MKSIKLILVGIVLLLSSCSTQQVSQTDYNQNAQVKSFWNQFNKSDFIKGINSKRLNAEDYVKAIKEQDLENDNIKSLYSSTQFAYNDVLSKMINDISAVDNILDLSTFNANNRYQIELQEAERKETKFINAASQLLYPDAETSFLGNLFNSVISFIPGARTIQNIYLNRLKLDLADKINQAKWKNWDSI